MILVYDRDVCAEACSECGGGKVGPKGRGTGWSIEVVVPWLPVKWSCMGVYDGNEV